MQKTSSPLGKWFQNVMPPFPKTLAWCHTTDAWSLRDMIKDQKISPRRCEVFNEDLSFFFYGRPAFRRGANEIAGLNAAAPVVIILHPDLIDDGVRLHPFDTGAFATQRYSEWMHSQMSISDFELACDIQIPPKHVSAFFRTNKAYLDLVCNGVSIPYCGEFEVESIVSLLSAQSTATADDRRLAMELQIAKSIVFDSSSILGLIIPDEIRQANWFDVFIRGPGAGIELLDYQFSKQRQAIQYQTTLEKIAADLQKTRGLL